MGRLFSRKKPTGMPSAGDHSSAGMDNRFRDLFELIQHTERITTKIHGIPEKDAIFSIVEHELRKLTHNRALILLLEEDNKNAAIRFVTIPDKILKTIDATLGSSASKLTINMVNGTVMRRVIDTGETYSFKTIEWAKEIMPGPLAYTVAAITGHLRKTTIVSPLTVRGTVRGIFAMDSHEMVDIFLLSVKNLALHISAALEFAELNEKRDILEKELRRKEAAIRSIFMAAPVGIIVSENRTIIKINRRVCEITGYTEKELLGRNKFVLFNNETEFDRVGRELYGSHPGDERSSVETKMKRMDGVLIDVMLTASSIEGTDCTIVTLTDITERKRAERAFAESERNFRRMFEITSESVALLDPETNRFISANPAMCALFGYSEEEFRSLSPEDITPQEAKEIMRGAMATLAEGGNIPDHEGISVRKDGSKINVLVSNRHMLWHGKPVYHITFKNITTLKEIQEQLRKKSLEVIEFTNMVTHDLRKPLTTMKLVMDITGKGAFGALNDDGVEAIGAGLETAEYMQEMLEDLMACARLDAGKQELTIEETGYMELAGTVISRLKYQLEEKKIRVETAGEEVTVRADTKQLTRVPMNLVGNAVNYIGNGPDKRIRIGWERRDGAPVFFVEDNGMGIPPETQKHLFEKFKRGSNVSGIAGTGLGLAIVKGIVEAHGGSIRFESEEGKGTTFYFTLGRNDGRPPDAEER
ncbi:MAG: PAS domain-containing sensor histidine kinase [Chitinispirillaceae bacterium]|nr:PAS domain-containing sensor histidine kinase [Chitinispirillaceae bacterium]